MIPEKIKNLINAHKQKNDRLNFNKSLKHIVASKVATFAGGTYEMVRNAIQLEQDHLLRRRAIHRILLRLGALSSGEPIDLAEDLLSEIVWGKYTAGAPIPEIAIEQAGKIIQKYQVLVARYRSRYGTPLQQNNISDLYGILSFEIERLIVPYQDKDALVNFQYSFLLPLRLIRDSDLPEKFEPIQTYISVLRTLTKFDNEMVRYYMFFNAFQSWGRPTITDIDVIVQKLENTLTDIRNHLAYVPKNIKLKEFIRQSIPLKILNQVISDNIENVEKILIDKSQRDKEVYTVCNREYSQVRSKIVRTTIKTMIYLAITKMVMALIVEVPYEFYQYGHLNYLPLGINLLLPPVLMGIIASSFKIPYKANTEGIIEMVDRYMDPSSHKYENFGLSRRRRKPVLRFIFSMISNIIFIAVMAVVTYSLKKYVGYDNLGVGIFMLFLSLVSFGALRTRNIATELIVIPEGKNIFTPLINLVAIPILTVGKKLSVGLSFFSPLPIIFDYIFESPIKGFIRVFEEWNSFMKEQREEII